MEQLRKIFESLGLVGLVSHLLTLTRLLTGHWQGAKAAHSALANLRLDLTQPSSIFICWRRFAVVCVLSQPALWAARVSSP